MNNIIGGDRRRGGGVGGGGSRSCGSLSVRVGWLVEICCS
jgi:hypothetical protein